MVSNSETQIQIYIFKFILLQQVFISYNITIVKASVAESLDYFFSLLLILYLIFIYNLKLVCDAN